MHAKTPKNIDVSSIEMLLDAVVTGWSTGGYASVSARGVARRSGLPTSSIYHHFGDLKQLFLEAQNHILARSKQWCTDRLAAMLAEPTWPPEAFAPLFASLIDDWLRENRAFALAWRETYLLAARDPDFAPALHRWQALWAGFWEEICARCGLAGMGEITSYAFDGEAFLHLFQWRRHVDRACLDELAQGWGRWLTGHLAEEGPWRRYAREEALRSQPDLHLQSGVAADIAIAAADVVEQSGLAGLTHRAVADRAGMTLGTTSYHFKTVGDLVRAAYETIYTRIENSGSSAGAPAGGDMTQDLAATFRTTAPLFLAMEELIVATARDPDLREFAPRLRYLRGRGSGPILQAMLGEGRTVSPLDAALYSGFLSGQARAWRWAAEADRQASFERASARLLDVLDRTGAA